jgi:hypothetical protein
LGVPGHTPAGVDMDSLVRKRAMIVAFVAGFGLLLVLGYWKFALGDRDEPIRTIVADLRQRTAPPGTRTLATSDLESDQRSVKVFWIIELDQDWNEYCRWVRGSCADFKTVGPKDGKMVMLKQLPGDTLRLTIEKLTDMPLQVRVSFVGAPS